MTKSFKDSIILGLALFAMFFGAGNLIFPTSVGLSAGSEWLKALAGFGITGIVLPLFGVMAVMSAGGTLLSFGSRAGSKIGLIYGTVVISSLGLVAVSRTAATTYEMGIYPNLPSISPIISSVVFFLITWLLSVNPTGIIDRIGKILTPILLVMLSIIIYKGVTQPMGIIETTDIIKPFNFGFFGGYQTMDAMGSAILGGIVIASLLEKGYSTKYEQMTMTFKSVLIAGLGLVLVYGGLLYLGATGTTLFDGTLSKTSLTVSIVQAILGDTGKIILGLCVSFACLTTSIGLTATIGDYFSNLSKGKISYKTVVTITVVLCGIISNFGVDMIVQLASPLLVAMYPVTIVLIILNLFARFIKDNAAFTGAVIGAFSVSLFDGLKTAGFEIASVQSFIDSLPLADSGFGWMTPALLGFMIAPIISKFNKTKKQRPNTRKPATQA